MYSSNTALLTKLRRLHGDIIGHTLLTQAKRLRSLAVKAGFRPNQPRVGNHRLVCEEK
jgi:hypothetical protein